MERLGAQDLASVTGDDAGWPWDIGAIGVLDGTGLVDGDGRFRIEAVRRVIEPRLHLVPHSRQLLYRPPPGPGWPPLAGAAWCKDGHQFGHTVSRQSPGVEGEK